MENKKIVGWQMVNGGNFEPVYDEAFEAPPKEVGEQLVGKLVKEVAKQIDEEIERQNMQNSEEKLGNLTLRPLRNVAMWDTKRILAYKNRINKFISSLETKGMWHADIEHMEDSDYTNKILKKVKNYKEELKRILAKRENIK